MQVRVVVLGSSGGLPTPERGLPAVILEGGGWIILMDCGEGTQRQMMRAGYSLCKKMKVFITHLHGDHVFGLPGMIQSMNLLNRIHPLEVYGPKGLKDFIEDTTISTMSEPNFDLSVFEVEEGEIFSSRDLVVRGVWADHSRANMSYRVNFGRNQGKFHPERAKELGIPEGPLWGMLKSGKSVILEGGRVVEPKEVLGEIVPGISVVYTGDTRYCERVVELANGADLLIHEATFGSDLAERAREEGHSTAEDAAMVASSAGVKKLILTHISSRYPDAKILEDEARRIFQNVEVARDLGAYDLKS
ncbi:MAG: ribonuclease Z [Candidatus Methanomethylicaceae archaeon]|nr:ribonuclease Z [Candidatus Verstraetearchaeota archaeon]